MAVTAQHEERRAQPRVDESSQQLEISVDGRGITTEDWSIGEFRSYGLQSYAKKRALHRPNQDPRQQRRNTVYRPDYPGGGGWRAHCQPGRH